MCSLIHTYPYYQLVATLFTGICLYCLFSDKTLYLSMCDHRFINALQGQVSRRSKTQK